MWRDGVARRRWESVQCESKLVASSPRAIDDQLLRRRATEQKKKNSIDREKRVPSPYLRQARHNAYLQPCFALRRHCPRRRVHQRSCRSIIIDHHTSTLFYLRSRDDDGPHSVGRLDFMIVVLAFVAAVRWSVDTRKIRRRRRSQPTRRTSQ
jgi:hypothetical protein